MHDQTAMHESVTVYSYSVMKRIPTVVDLQPQVLVFGNVALVHGASFQFIVKALLV